MSPDIALSEVHENGSEHSQWAMREPANRSVTDPPKWIGCTEPTALQHPSKGHEAGQLSNSHPCRETTMGADNLRPEHGPQLLEDGSHQSPGPSPPTAVLMTPKVSSPEENNLESVKVGVDPLVAPRHLQCKQSGCFRKGHQRPATKSSHIQAKSLVCSCFHNLVRATKSLQAQMATIGWHESPHFLEATNADFPSASEVLRPSQLGLWGCEPLQARGDPYIGNCRIFSVGDFLPHFSCTKLPRFRIQKGDQKHIPWLRTTYNLQVIAWSSKYQGVDPHASKTTGAVKDQTPLDRI